jgi:hypothetical protein
MHYVAHFTAYQVGEWEKSMHYENYALLADAL